MNYRKINNNKVSLLGMGCMRLPIDENNEINVEKTEEMIKYAMEMALIIMIQLIHIIMVKVK